MDRRWSGPSLYQESIKGGLAGKAGRTGDGSTVFASSYMWLLTTRGIVSKKERNATGVKT